MEGLKDELEDKIFSALEAVNYLINEASSFGYDVDITVRIVDGRIDLVHDLTEREV